MGAATSVPGEYLVSPKLTRRKAKKMCEQANILWSGTRKESYIEIHPEVELPAPNSTRGKRTKKISVRPRTPGADLLFDSICDEKGKISRMQVLWAASNFTEKGQLQPFSFFQAKCDATREAARIAMLAAASADKIIADMIPNMDRIFEARKRTVQAAALAAQMAQDACSTASVFDANFMKEIKARASRNKKMKRQESALDRLKGVCVSQARNKKFVSSSFQALEKWKQVQAEVDKAMRACKLVTVDVLKKQISFKKNIQFKGGGATILGESNDVMKEAALALTSLQTVLKKMHEPPLHFSVEGHVAMTNDPERCMRISKERADAAADFFTKNGTPRKFLHPRGFGATQPISTNPLKQDANRRVEIQLLSQLEAEDQEEDTNGGPVIIHQNLAARPRRMSMVEKESAMIDTVKSMPKKKKQELETVFNLFDKDGSGELDTDEVVKLLNLLGQEVTAKEAEELIDAVDVDGNRELDFNEFVYAVAGDHDKSTRTKLQAAFNMFDVDGSGTIDREELRTVAASLGEVFTDDDIDELIKAADSDGDGEISIEEFCDLLLESITE